jgi:uncharacterized protein (TIGR03118 family)
MSDDLVQMSDDLVTPVTLLGPPSTLLNSPSTPTFIQNNLIADTPGAALILDPNLVNPWGISIPSGGGPFWISDQASNMSSIDGLTGVTVTLNAIPPIAVPSPTGQVFNSFANAFSLPNGSAAKFLFASTNGGIYGWNGGSSVAVVTTPGAAYTGLAIGTSANGPTLYAANNKAGTVDMFDSSFKMIKSFTPDPTIPAGFGPYNVQVLNNSVYVTYSHQDRSVGAGVGFIDQYDLNGNLVSQVAAGGTLDAPWGLAIAPPTFGEFASDLLVGNFGDGAINVFNPTSHQFLGQLDNSSGQPIHIDGLWSLVPGLGGSGGDPNQIYFTAGPSHETHGLFGTISAA